MSEFLDDLRAVINRHSKENASNTPHYLLAQYLEACLATFDTIVQQRETWYGRDPRPSYPGTKLAEDHDLHRKITERMASKETKELEGIASRIAHTRPKGRPLIPNLATQEQRLEIEATHSHECSAWLSLVIMHGEELATDYLAALAELRAIKETGDG